MKILVAAAQGSKMPKSANKRGCESSSPQDVNAVHKVDGSSAAVISCLEVDCFGKSN